MHHRVAGGEAALIKVAEMRFDPVVRYTEQILNLLLVFGKIHDGADGARHHSDWRQHYRFIRLPLEDDSILSSGFQSERSVLIRTHAERSIKRREIHQELLLVIPLGIGILSTKDNALDLRCEVLIGKADFTKPAFCT